MRKYAGRIILAITILLIAWHAYPRICTVVNPQGRWKSLMRQAAAAKRSGHLDQADQHYSEALAIAAGFRRDDLRIAKTAIALGDVCREEYRAASAVAGINLYRPPSLIDGIRGGLDSFRATLKMRERYKMVKSSRTYLPRTVNLYRKALNVYTSAYSAKSPKLSSYCFVLEKRFERLGCAYGVLDCFDVVLRQKSAEYGNSSPQLAAVSKQIIASLGRMAPTADRPRPVYEKLIDLSTNLYGREDDRTQNWLRQLADITEPARAEPLCRSILATSEKKHGKDSIAILGDIAALSRCYRRIGNLTVAEQLSLRGIQIAENWSGKSCKQMAEQISCGGSSKELEYVYSLLDNHAHILEQMRRTKEADQIRSWLAD